MSVWTEAKQILKETAQIVPNMVKEFKASTPRNKAVTAGSYLVNVAVGAGVFIGFTAVASPIALTGIFVGGVAVAVANDKIAKKLKAQPSMTAEAPAAAAPAVVSEAPAAQAESPAAAFNTEAAPAQEAAAAPAVETKPQPPAAG